MLRRRIGCNIHRRLCPAFFRKDGYKFDISNIQPIIRRVFGTTCSVRSGLSKSDCTGRRVGECSQTLNNFLVFSEDNDGGNNGWPRAATWWCTGGSGCTGMTSRPGTSSVLIWSSSSSQYLQDLLPAIIHQLQTVSIEPWVTQLPWKHPLRFDFSSKPFLTNLEMSDVESNIIHWKVEVLSTWKNSHFWFELI